MERFLDGDVDDSLLAEMLLVTSELVTNAVRHGNRSEPVWLHVLLLPDEITITVSGNGLPGGPRPTFRGGELAPAAESGRGLRIVRELCDDVAVHDGEVTVVRVVRRLH